MKYYVNVIAVNDHKGVSCLSLSKSNFKLLRVCTSEILDIFKVLIYCKFVVGLH